MSLLKAREGKYNAEAISKLPEGLIGKYFKHEGWCSIKQEIKQFVDFRRHNLVSDEPFTNLDLISCRNVLIYFTRDLQEKVFMSLYHGLRPGGFLFLGRAETLFAEAARLFCVVDKRWRLYQKL